MQLVVTFPLRIDRGRCPRYHAICSFTHNARREDPDERDVSSSSMAPGPPPPAACTLTVLNPATSEPLGKVAHAEKADLDRALEAAEQAASRPWRMRSRRWSASKVLRKAAELLRERADDDRRPS
jgi:acyl-CoA reductase-like NAD-dependent aldehyde dehydrogenase